MVEFAKLMGDVVVLLKLSICYSLDIPVIVDSYPLIRCKLSANICILEGAIDRQLNICLVGGKGEPCGKQGWKYLLAVRGS